MLLHLPPSVASPPYEEAAGHDGDDEQDNKNDGDIASSRDRHVECRSLKCGTARECTARAMDRVELGGAIRDGRSVELISLAPEQFIKWGRGRVIAPGCFTSCQAWLEAFQRGP